MPNKRVRHLASQLPSNSTKQILEALSIISNDLISTSPVQVVSEIQRSLPEIRKRDIVKFLQQQFPDVRWKEATTTRTTTSLNQIQVQKELLHKVEGALNITHPSGWHKVDTHQLERALQSLPSQDAKSFTSLVVAYYQSSILKMLRQLHPEQQWDVLRFKIRPRESLLSSPDIQKDMVRQLESELNIKRPEQWYNFTRTEVEDVAKRIDLLKSFSTIVRTYYNNRMYEMLQALYPSVQWNMHSFKQAPRDSIAKLDHRQIFEAIHKQLDIRSPQDWAQYGYEDILQAAENAGIRRKSVESLIKNYYDSYVHAVKAFFPDAELSPRKSNIIVSLDSSRRTFQLIEKELNISSPQDWYKVSLKQVKQAAAALGVGRIVGTLLYKYRNRLSVMLQNVFPEYELDSIYFKRLPKNALAISNERQVLNTVVRVIEDQLMIEKPEDWYRVSQNQMAAVTRLALIQKLGGLKTLLPSAYPSFDWDYEMLVKKGEKKSQQRLLYVFVKKLLGPQVTIIENFYAEDLKFAASQENVQFDVWVSDYKLAFEYNGEHHYKELGVFGSFREYQQRDAEKKELCVAAGITLIVIPYTWDSSIASIASLLHEQRSDIPLTTSR